MKEMAVRGEDGGGRRLNIHLTTAEEYELLRRLKLLAAAKGTSYKRLVLLAITQMVTEELPAILKREQQG